MRTGITTFDTADHYGPSEQLIGALRSPWLCAYTRMTVQEHSTPKVVQSLLFRSMSMSSDAKIL